MTIRTIAVPIVGFLASLLLGVPKSAAEPASIGVNFSHNTKVLSTANPGVLPGRNWNNVSTALGTTLNLHNDSRDETNADVTVISGSAYAAFGAGKTEDSGYNQMVDDGICGAGNGGDNTEARVSFDQIPFANYDVYVFTQSRTRNAKELSITLGETTYYYVSDDGAAADEIKQIMSKTPGLPTPNGSYALFRNVSGTTFTVTTGGSASGAISNQIFGIHIVDASAMPTLRGHTPPKSKTAFLSQYCIRCHGADKHKGDVRLDQIGLSVTGDNHKLWEEVVHNVQRGDMPPEEAQQPRSVERQAFLAEVMPLLARYEADTLAREPLMRLTNNQLAHSLQDLLSTHENIFDKLIGDPIDKHGYSRQSELDLSGASLQLYIRALEQVVTRTVLDPQAKPDNVFRVAGNDWEKCHWAGDNFLYRRFRALYEGPDWLGDDFEIPLPPKHEYRMFLRDNRSHGKFRLRLTVRNEPPANGQPRTPQELAVYLDQGEEAQYKLVKAVHVPAKEGSQQFEMFGRLSDHLGVRAEPIPKDLKSLVKGAAKTSGYWLNFRTLSIVNHNKLVGFPLPSKFLTTKALFCVRADDQWIKAFGTKPGLLPSTNGNNGRHGNEGGGSPVYPEAMKTHGHAIIEKVEFEVPYYKSWPPASVEPFVTNGRITRENLPARLKVFAAKAWRRPLNVVDASHIEKLVAEELAAGSSDLDAQRNSVVTILCDPRFLYLGRSDNYDLVSRLSYFLWNGPPDAKLMALAGQGKPIDNATLHREVDRLLADKRSKRFVDDFVARWIGFGAFDQTAIDPNYYPGFHFRAKDYMKQESIAFFSEILYRDLSCLNFLESDFVMVNETLAEHYGIPDVNSQRFQAVPAPKSRGGGVLAQGAFLLAHSNGQDAHAVNRGVWVRSRLLGDPPSDPPPEVPSLNEERADKRQKGPVSIKQKLELHLATGTTCYDCHKDIDPWGIAMEGFDAVGLPRTTIVRVGPVVSDVVIDGHRINGLVPLKQYLVKERHKQFAYGLTRHMLSYALGRPLSYKDEQQVLSLQKQFEASGYRMKDLIKAIVVSTAFSQGN